MKYNLAYVNPPILRGRFQFCAVDHDRVLGYDNIHDYHHRHFMGTVEPVEFDKYESLSERFYAEVIELWRKEDEQRT